MQVVRELKNTITLENVKDVYIRGNKLAIKNSYDMCIGFTDDVHLGKDIINIENKVVECSESCYLVEDHQINAKKDTLIVLDSIYIDEEEKDFLARIKPFTGNFKDCWVTVYLFENGNIPYEKVYEVEG